LDRLTREGTRATLNYLPRLESKGVGYVSYQEQWLDSTGPFKDGMISMFATHAKQERARISERTIAGLKVVRAKDKRLGRPPLAQTCSQRTPWEHGSMSIRVATWSGTAELMIPHGSVVACRPVTTVAVSTPFASPSTPHLGVMMEFESSGLRQNEFCRPVLQSYELAVAVYPMRGPAIEDAPGILQEMFDVSRGERIKAGAKIDYSVIKDNWFVISGVDKGTEF
jgi:hypothetical protein